MTGHKPDERIRTPMRWDGRPGRWFQQRHAVGAAERRPAEVNVAGEAADPDSLLSTYRALVAPARRPSAPCRRGAGRRSSRPTRRQRLPPPGGRRDRRRRGQPGRRAVADARADPGRRDSLRHPSADSLLGPPSSRPPRSPRLAGSTAGSGLGALGPRETVVIELGAVTRRDRAALTTDASTSRRAPTEDDADRPARRRRRARRGDPDRQRRPGPRWHDRGRVRPAGWRRADPRPTAALNLGSIVVGLLIRYGPCMAARRQLRRGARVPRSRRGAGKRAGATPRHRGCGRGRSSCC